MWNVECGMKNGDVTHELWKFSILHSHFFIVPSLLLPLHAVAAVVLGAVEGGVGP
jgi:hypothetical protein